MKREVRRDQCSPSRRRSDSPAGHPANSAGRDPEGGGDLRVRLPLSHQVKDFALSGREPVGWTLLQEKPATDRVQKERALPAVDRHRLARERLPPPIGDVAGQPTRHVAEVVGKEAGRRQRRDVDAARAIQ